MLGMGLLLGMAAAGRREGTTGRRARDASLCRTALTAASRQRGETAYHWLTVREYHLRGRPLTVAVRAKARPRATRPVVRRPNTRPGPARRSPRPCPQPATLRCSIGTRRFPSRQRWPGWPPQNPPVA